MKPGAALLRIRLNQVQPPQHCEWALLVAGREPLLGAGALSTMPPHSGPVECVLPAADVLLTRCVLPVTARNPAPELLAFAAEESLASDPAATSVCRLALTAGGESVLAVVEKATLTHWRSALAAAGIAEPAFLCETLQLPIEPDTWSIGWNGSEGCVRTAAAEGCATDSGDRLTPPLSLRLLLAAARRNGDCPLALVVHADNETSQPDVDAWSQALGLEVNIGAPWCWHASVIAAGPALFQQRRHWQRMATVLPRLRPALWLLTVALAVHAGLVLQAWGSLAAEQASLRAQMDARFRQVFPDAVAVVDPVLQMRRQLATARLRTGLPDDGDFLPLLARVAAAGGITAGSLGIISYEPGRLTLELLSMPAADLAQLVALLQQAGLGVELQPAAGDSSASVLTVRPS